ncbi:MAG: ComF family protein [Arcobacteraceae bacterium]|nr:ComF family protein [Arcobacteraceae bacterium]
MRCLSCQNLSIQIICKTCQENLLQSIFKKRELDDDFAVYSFFEYEDIKELLNTKYEFYGDRVYKILANLSFKKFADNFNFDENVVAVSVDDNTTHEFSQSAILVNALRSKNITPIYSTLKARNRLKYAGKSLEYRQKHKRDFKYKGKQNLKVILVDDIITTGSTLKEAKEVIEKSNCEVLFALTLSDAKIQ